VCVDSGTHTCTLAQEGCLASFECETLSMEECLLEVVCVGIFARSKELLNPILALGFCTLSFRAATFCNSEKASFCGGCSNFNTCLVFISACVLVALAVAQMPGCYTNSRAVCTCTYLRSVVRARGGEEATVHDSDFSHVDLYLLEVVSHFLREVYHHLGLRHTTIGMRHTCR